MPVPNANGFASKWNIGFRKRAPGENRPPPSCEGVLPSTERTFHWEVEQKVVKSYVKRLQAK